MLNEDSFQYAIESMVVVRAPQQRIETFGNTSFRFYLVTELMDSAHQVRVREGYLHIERPQIVTPGFIKRSLLEGFGERAEEFVGWLQENARDLAIVKYGFQFRKTAVVEELIQAKADITASSNTGMVVPECHSEKGIAHSLNTPFSSTTLNS